MIKELEISDPYSCLNKAFSDEPLFVIRAKDPLATMTILQWCEARCRLGLNIPGDEKMLEAVACTYLIDEWRKKHPDLIKVIA